MPAVGVEALSGQNGLKMAFWTHYGRWLGPAVLNNHGQVIYELPDCLDERPVLIGALPIGLPGSRDPAQECRGRPVHQKW